VTPSKQDEKRRMRESREFICVTCPLGCSIQAVVDGDRLVSIDGQSCKRGEAFVREELSAPKRMLTTTVQVRGGVLPLVPVRSTEPLPKERIFDVAALLRRVVLDAPVAARQMVAANAVGSGVDIVTSRAVDAVKRESVRQF